MTTTADDLLRSIVTGMHKLVAPDTLPEPMLDDICAISDAIHAMEDAAPRWIPVTERLPEKNGWYIVARKLDTDAGLPPLETTIRQFYVTSGWQSVSEAYPVTHWMPLPQPPQKEK